MKIDLHIHSRFSDGMDELEDLIPKIAEAGVDVFALTDHDRTDGWAEAVELSRKYGLSFIPGIELTTQGKFHDKPFGIHLLAYLPNPEDPDLKELLLENQQLRETRMQRFVKNLQTEYPDLKYEDVISGAKALSTLGRPDLVNALWNLGIFDDIQDVWEGPVAKGSPYYVSIKARDVLEIIKIVRKAGGVPVMAHPLSRLDSDDSQPEHFPEEHFELMVDAGLLGLETSHIEVSEKMRAVLETFAAKHNLITTGSSDYHGPRGKKIANTLAVRTTSVEMLKRIIEAGTGTAPTLSHQL